MTDFSNLTGLEKPLTKLVETISEGLGVVGNHIFDFDAKKIRRIGEAEAEIEKIKIIQKAGGEAKALDILDRAGKRFALEQYNKQINLENIIVKSQEQIVDKDVNDEAVDRDWTARFLSIAQDVSKEDMQDILARILSNEITRPSTYSLRTLDLVRNMSSKELLAFRQFVPLSTKGIGILEIDGGGKENFEKYNLNFTDYIELTDIGLFNSNSNLSVSFKLIKEKPLTLEIGNTLLNIATTQEQKSFSSHLIKFTEVGAQLASLMVDSSVNDKKQDYLDYLKGRINAMGFEVNRLDVMS